MISIIIPIYNKEKYIDNLVNKLYKQTYKDFEIIFVDDGSVDNSYKVALKYANNTNVFVYSQKNSGVSVARNKGIDESRGEWISFLDPDDDIADNYLEELKKNSARSDIVCCCCYACDTNKKYLNEFFYKDSIFKNKNKVELFRQLLNGSYNRSGKVYTAIGVPWGKLYKRKLIVNNKLRFDAKLKRQQDNAFNMYAFNKATEIKYINKPLYYYRLDNVKNYYRSKFDSYALKNAEELQKERYKFFVDEKHYDDILTKKIFNNETISVLVGAFNKYLLNKENNLSTKEKRKIYFQVISIECFRQIIDRLKVSEIQGFVHKIIALSMKLNLFFLFYLFGNFEVYMKNSSLIKDE